jgi:intracellular sulfur oxidation DsrE/DsrF family protein
VDRKLQHTLRLKANFGNTEGTNMLLNINHLVIAVKENQIQGVHHSNGVDTVGRDNPEALPRTGPAPSCAQEAHEPAEIAICHRGVSGNEALAGLVVDTNVVPSIKGKLAH